MKATNPTTRVRKVSNRGQGTTNPYRAGNKPGRSHHRANAQRRRYVHRTQYRYVGEHRTAGSVGIHDNQPTPTHPFTADARSSAEYAPTASGINSTTIDAVSGESKVVLTGSDY